MIYWLIGITIYLLFGYLYAEKYKRDCANNVEEEFEPGAYWVALFLWLLVEVLAFFVKEKP